MTRKNRMETKARPTPEQVSKIVREISLVGIVGNVILSAFKLAAGILGSSGAMVSDAVHSLSDVFATFIAFVGVKLSEREADATHPYGHERFECVASLLLGGILFAVGFGIGAAGLENITAGNHDQLEIPGTIALVAAVVSIVVKEAMFWYTRYYAKRISSTAFLADAWHHRSDAFSSVGSLLGIVGAMLGYPVLDSVASVVICLFILKVAYDIGKDAILKMLDIPCDEDTEDALRSFVQQQPEVQTIDLLRTRMFGNRVYVDLEIAMDGGKTLQECHHIGQTIHDGVERHFPAVKHIMIHINPAD